MKFKLFLLFSALLVGACNVNVGDICYSTNRFANVSEFDVQPNLVTPNGIAVDAKGIDFTNQDLQELDERIYKIWECVQEKLKKYEPQKQELMQQMSCLYWPIDEPIKYDCLTIKITPPAYSKCTNWQFITDKNGDRIPGPNQLCEAKGVTPTKECPCRWRTVTYNDNTIVTVPKETRVLENNVYLKAPYLYLWIGVITSCNNIWTGRVNGNHIFHDCVSL